MSKRLCAILLLSLLVLSAWLTSAAQAGPKNYLILASGQGKGSTAFADRVAAAGGLVVANLESVGVVTATSDNPNFAALMAAERGVKAVAEDPEIQWLPKETVVEAGSADVGTQPAANNELFSPLQWNLRAIHADQTAANGDRGWGVVRARVAVLDSGIVTNHQDIAPNLNLALSQSFVPGEGLMPPAGFNHGTHVAGIIAAPINGLGTQGVAPEAELVAIKVLRASGSGSFSWLIQGLEYAASIGADVANMSLGATFPRSPNAICDPTTGEKCGNAGPLMAALNRAINHATKAGVLCVSAAGNEGLNLNSQIVSIPAQSGNGMAVAATAPIGWAVDPAHANFDLPTSYTNFGLSVVNVAAPGGDSAYPGNEICTVGPRTRACWIFDLILSPGAINNGYFFAAGTSMAAPHVSGLAAVIVGKYGHMPPAQLKALIEQTATDILKPGADAFSGKGRIDAVNATAQ